MSSHDHATLFVAPSATPAVEAAGRADLAVDCGAQAMRRLRNPFAVQPVRATASTERRHRTHYEQRHFG